MSLAEKILKKNTDIDSMMLLLLMSGQYTFLPEIYEIFGKESAVKFLDIFSGTTIEIPSRDTLEELAHKLEVYQIYQLPNPPEPSELAEKYGVTTRRINKWYDDVESILKSNNKHILSNYKKAKEKLLNK